MIDLNNLDFNDHLYVISKKKEIWSVNCKRYKIHTIHMKDDISIEKVELIPENEAFNIYFLKYVVTKNPSDVFIELEVAEEECKKRNKLEKEKNKRTKVQRYIPNRVYVITLRYNGWDILKEPFRFIGNCTDCFGEDRVKVQSSHERYFPKDVVFWSFDEAKKECAIKNLVTFDKIHQEQESKFIEKRAYFLVKANYGWNIEHRKYLIDGDENENVIVRHYYNNDKISVPKLDIFNTLEEAKEEYIKRNSLQEL